MRHRWEVQFLQLCNHVGSRYRPPPPSSSSSSSSSLNLFFLCSSRSSSYFCSYSLSHHGIGWPVLLVGVLQGEVATQVDEEEEKEDAEDRALLELFRQEEQVRKKERTQEEQHVKREQREQHVHRCR